MVKELSHDKGPSAADRIGMYAVLITCFNRREQTLECLSRLFRSSIANQIDVYLLDDGCTDGTGDAVRTQFPQVHIYTGDGSYFWSRGMRVLWGQCGSKPYAGYLWLNDDNVLDDDAFERMLHWVTKTEGRAILAGSMRDSTTGQVSYGGWKRFSLHPMKFQRVLPDSQDALPADVLNGNLLYVPREVYERVGGIARGLVQNGADYEYSVRCRRNGVECLVLPGTFGDCSDNDWGPKKRGIAGLRKMLKPRHLPFGPTMWFVKGVAGPSWPVWYVGMYVKAFLFGY